jgi:hypothetical protein
MDEKKRLDTEDEVKRVLHIDSFENLTEDELVEFTKLLPQMDTNLTISILRQFHVCNQSVIPIVDTLIKQCHEILASSDDSRKDAVRNYEATLSCLRRELESDSLSESEKLEIRKRVFDDIPARIDNLDKRNKEFLTQFMKYVEHAAIIIALLVGGAAVLGSGTAYMHAREVNVQVINVQAGSVRADNVSQTNSSKKKTSPMQDDHKLDD